MKAWDVCVWDEDGDMSHPSGRIARVVNTVYYDNNCDAEYVLRACVDHDGMRCDFVYCPETKEISA